MVASENKNNNEHDGVARHCSDNQLEKQLVGARGLGSSGATYIRLDDSPLDPLVSPGQPSSEGSLLTKKE